MKYMLLLLFLLTGCKSLLIKEWTDKWNIRHQLWKKQ